MTIIRFEIPGQPVAKGRARVGIGKGGRPRLYTPKHTAEWEEYAALLARGAMGSRKPWDGPVQLEFTAAFRPPASWPKWKRQAAIRAEILKTSKPDKDNLEKAVCDALNGVVWVDDAQVVSGMSTKTYAEIPGVTVMIWFLSQPPDSITTLAEFAAYGAGTNLNGDE